MTNRTHRRLAQARRGQRLEVHDILFDLVRDRCFDLGIERGSVVICTENVEGRVELTLNDGTPRVLENHYAFFVETAQPESHSASTAAG